MPRFVILRHDTPPGSPRLSHWDLMLECGTGLCTWACNFLPDRNKTAEAQRLSDHRLAYLDHEGPVSGNRGTVTRWDAGEFQFTGKSPDRWVVQLHGEQLVGCLTLTLEDQQTGRWTISFSPSKAD